jgi:hypothetical protein
MGAGDGYDDSRVATHVPTDELMRIGTAMGDEKEY